MLYQGYLKGENGKKSYLYLIIIELIIFLILLLNSFESSILKGYKTLVFLIILIIYLNLFFALKKINIAIANI